MRTAASLSSSFFFESMEADVDLFFEKEVRRRVKHPVIDGCFLGQPPELRKTRASDGVNIFGSPTFRLT